ncbi:hypothetical protein F8M41_000304 [Gigaspora margarita]|uniref:Uncharacterized protein n=1 Tax=Gigaspora margarita TaxID=4874 RepID=A0A8H3XG97_GIGMA|nr:hypothetical protein F8M41_000304 [Gigaspora margarita]
MMSRYFSRDHIFGLMLNLFSFFPLEYSQDFKMGNGQKAQHKRERAKGSAQKTATSQLKSVCYIIYVCAFFVSLNFAFFFH